MLMEYWQNQDTKVVYGFDVSDPTQIQAMNQLINTGSWIMLTEPPKPIYNPTKEQNKKQAIFLLTETDYVNEPDVYDTSQPRYLLNRSEFIDYRTKIRAIALDPVEGQIDWPTMPKAQWSGA